MSVSRVFVCSKIPRLVQAMEAAVPKGVEFQEVRPEDVEKEEVRVVNSGRNVNHLHETDKFS